MTIMYIAGFDIRQSLFQVQDLDHTHSEPEKVLIFPLFISVFLMTGIP